MRTRRALVVLSVVALASLMAAVLGPTAPLMAVVAMAILLMPGAAVVWAFMPGDSLDGVERLMLSLGTSLALMVVVGLALNATPWGLSPAAWTAALLMVTVVGAVAAWRRDGTLVLEMAPISRSGVLALSVLSLSLIVVISAVAASARSAREASDTRTTQLWMLPRDEFVEIGVQSLEESTASYRVELLVDGRLEATWTIDRLVPGDEWTEPIDAQLRRRGALEVHLYRGVDDAEPYRAVSLEPIEQDGAP